jgi:hypothetical protein
MSSSLRDGRPVQCLQQKQPPELELDREGLTLNSCFSQQPRPATNNMLSLARSPVTICPAVIPPRSHKGSSTPVIMETTTWDKHLYMVREPSHCHITGRSLCEGMFVDECLTSTKTTYHHHLRPTIPIYLQESLQCAILKALLGFVEACHSFLEKVHGWMGRICYGTSMYDHSAAVRQG